MNRNTDRSPAAFTLLAALALCFAVVGPVTANASAVGSAPDAETRTGSTSAAALAAGTNGTATPTTGTATPPGTPTSTSTPTPAETPASDPTSSPTPGASPSGNETFVVAALEAPDALRAGDRLEVTATVRNRASANRTGTLRYSFGGSTVASRTVTLGPGESTAVAFEVPFAALETAAGSVGPGTYVHGVRNGSGGGVARRLRVTPDVDLTVEAFDAPVEVAHGEPYIVLATVGNPGDVSITRDVAYEFAGEAVASRAVTVAGGDTRRVAFEIRLSDAEAVVGTVRTETTYGHGVVAGSDREGGAVRVVRGSSANASSLAVESFEVTDDVRPGESYSVNLSVRNVDTTDFEGQLSYRVDGAVVATEWARVPVGERRTVEFRVGYDLVTDATGALSSPETVHGVFVGGDAVVTRPVTVYAPPETATPPPPTFAASGPTRTARTPSPAPDPTAGPSRSEGCERGFFAACGGAAMDETSLTLFGVLLSGFGIVYEMYRGRR